jgi:hypothetical protein
MKGKSWRTPILPIIDVRSRAITGPYWLPKNAGRFAPAASSGAFTIAYLALLAGEDAPVLWRGLCAASTNLVTAMGRTCTWSTGRRISRSARGNSRADLTGDWHGHACGVQS